MVRKLLHPLGFVAGFLICAAYALAQDAAPAAPQTLVEALMPALVELAVGVVALVALFFKAGVPALIRAHTDRGLTQSALLLLADTAAAVVTAAEQTTGSHLRRALADGKISREEFDEAMRQLAIESKDAVFRATVGRLTSSLGWSEDEVKKAVDARVEAAVPTAKTIVAASQAPVTAHP
jgi:hypothetical protein